MNEDKPASATQATLLAQRAALQQAEVTLRSRVDALSRQLDDATTEAERYKQFFDANDEPRLIADRMGTIREANPAACEVLGVAPVHLPGKPLAVFVHPDDRFELRARIKASSRAGLRFGFRLVGRGRSPQEVFVQTSPLSDGSGALWCIEQVATSPKTSASPR